MVTRLAVEGCHGTQKLAEFVELSVYALMQADQVRVQLPVPVVNSDLVQ